MASEVAAVAGVVGAASQAKTVLWAPLMDTIASSNDLEEIYEALNEAMASLCAKRDDHQNTVQRNKTKMPSKTFDDWIFRVMKIEVQVEKVLARYDKEKKRSPLICFIPRSNFSEEMKRTGLKVVKLLEEGNQLGDFLIDKEPERVVKMIAPEIKEFPTLQMQLERILDFLTNNNVKGIRVHGTVGVGKTTIMQSLNNQEKVADMFEIVIWVKVSMEESKENLSTERLQQAIVQRLKLDMEGTSYVDEVARKIKEELEGWKYLLLLDDVKEDLDLNQIGIPNGKNGSKIVLTTRLGRVCNPFVDMVINVTKLSSKEAWKMFQNVLNRPELMDNPKIARLVPRLVKLCDGLPLMIKIAASAFKMRDTEDRWIDGLNNLRKWPEKGDHAMKEMYTLLNFCYDNLNGAQKHCFLYGALYPEDSNIYTSCLLECWAAEDFLGSDDDVEEVRVNGRDILEHLLIVSLLEEGVSRQYVRMHKWIRKAALYILSADDERKYLVKTSEALQKPPDVECWTQKNWISLVDNKLHTLPNHPNCSMLSTLLLQKNSNLEKIPASFFEHMENLRVLDMYCSGIRSLPSSLSKLISLKVLFVNGCTNLMKLPSQIGELQHLEVLDIRGSGVNNIPPQIQSLIRLRRLRVSFTNSNNENDAQCVVSNCKVISKLSTLEELVVDVKSNKQWCNKMLNDVIEKVAATLTKLRTLQFCFLDGVFDVIKVVAATPIIHVPKADNLSSFVEKRDDLYFSSFQVFVNCEISPRPEIPQSFRYERFVKYCNGEGSNPTIYKVLAKVDSFELVSHNDLEHLSKFETASMNQLRCCLIESCNKIRTIVDGNCTEDSSILPNLERLYVKNLPDLKSIWEGPVQLGSLSKLKRLVLSGCQMLIKIFSHGVIQLLFELRHLEIEHCSGIEEIVMESENVGLEPCVLPNLKKLILLDLPNLRRICTNKSLEWSSLEKLKIDGCPSLGELPFSKENATNLRYIEAEQDWWGTLQWQDPEVKERLSAIQCHLS